MDEDQTIDLEFLWNVLGRVDHYIGTTNAKATLVLAFNTFILGGSALKADDFVKPLAASASLSGAAISLLVFIGLTSLVSLWITFSVVSPYLAANKSLPGSTYRSNIYFGDIAQAKDGRCYGQIVHHAQGEVLFEDLARQVHVVSDIALKKFNRLRHAVFIAAFLQCPSLFALLVIHVVTAPGRAL